MPKRFLLALAILSLAVVACNNANPYALVSVAPSVTAVPYSPNPAVTAAIVQVTVSSSPTAGLTVYEATPAPNGSLSTSNPLAIATTGPNGQVTFSGLVYNGTYCWWYNIQPPSVVSSVCTMQWQGTVITLGN